MNYQNLLSAIVTALLTCSSLAAHAASPAYPEKPIRLIVPSPPGGGNDIMARIAAHHLTESWGKQVIVDNRPGAGGAIAFEMAARAEPNGYTLLLGSTNLTVLPDITKVAYSPVKDFDPITLMAKSMNILLVHPSLPARNTQELIALARKSPGKLNYASSTATSVHLAAELFKAMAGVDITYIPYKGMGPALIDLIAGNVNMAFSNPAASHGFVQSGKLRALAVTGERRSNMMPEVPTIAEAALPGFEASTWWGILTPAGTPSTIINKTNTELANALKLPAVTNRIAALGADIVSGTPQALADHLREEISKWRKVVRAANIKL